MRPVKIRPYLTLVQIVVLLVAIGGILFLNKDKVAQFFQTTQTGQMGLMLNSLILLLFLFGLVRIVLLLLSYAREVSTLNKFVARARDKVANPTFRMPESSLIVGRYKAVQLISQQNAVVDQSALAASTAALQSSRFTLIRFVHNSLILTGVFGTIISLSIALVGAAALLESPDSLDNMSTIISGMSTALSTTITAIVCYIFYTYFHLRLQDARMQLLATLEEVTTLYILPQFRSIEGNMLHDVAILTAELRTAAEAVGQMQERFLRVGDRLQLAVDDLQSSIGEGSRDIRMIRDSLREGFRLDAVAESTHHPSRSEP